MTEPGGDTLAELEPFLADGHGGSTGELRSPLRDLVERTADGAWDEARVRPEVLVGLDVDEGRAIRTANEAGELVGRDAVE